MIPKTTLFAVLALVVCLTGARGQLIISQYVDTDSGTTPKGMELWNPSESIIDFSIQNLDILKGTNGGALSSDFILSSGTLDPGAVMVVGTSDMGDYLVSNGLSGVSYYEETFTFNGNDALQVQLDGVVQDTFGIPGSDPGTAWSGSGVSTADQNIGIVESVTTGDVDGWSDPSLRFQTISTNPSGVGGLDGFGVAPSAVPEPSTYGVITGLVVLGLALYRRRGWKRDI